MLSSLSTSKSAAIRTPSTPMHRFGLDHWTLRLAEMLVASTWSSLTSVSHPRNLNLSTDMPFCKCFKSSYILSSSWQEMVENQWAVLFCVWHQEQARWFCTHCSEFLKMWQQAPFAYIVSSTPMRKPIKSGTRLAYRLQYATSTMMLLGHYY